MSTAPVQIKPAKFKKEKERDKERKASLPQPNERLKAVVRRLPPNLPEEIFWQSVQEWVTDETSVWKAFLPGKLRKKLNKENVPSRAYIAFKDEEHLAAFSRAYDGHVFRDKTGAESQAVVEFAPYPKIPSEKRKHDPRNGTIEKDEDYISFLESLKASENAEPVSLEALIASVQPAPPPKTTPLLEALKAEKSANKDKEAILRNHAHYNNMSIATLRKEEKKKAAATSTASSAAKAGPSSNGVAATATTSQPISKKAKKAQAAAAAASSQTAKNTPQAQTALATNSKATSNNSAPANPSAKPAKPTRPPRGQNKASASTKEAARTETTTTPTILAPPSTNASAPATTPNTDVPAASVPAATAGRRTRPVVGLGSRQFEAALNGVSALASVASERKRREREKDGQTSSGTKTANSSGAPAAATSSVPPTPVTSESSANFARIDESDAEQQPALSTKAKAPPSPKRETRRGGRRGHNASGGGGGSSTAGGDTNTTANASQVKVPSILQRPFGIQTQQDGKDPSASAPTSVGVKGTPAPPASGNAEGAPSGSGAARGGGRRGRGGGRGRGAPAGSTNTPRGG